MADNQQFATKQDLTEVKAELKQDLVQMEGRLRNDLTEVMREMQTEILRGLERFAKGNFSRMHRLEVSDIDTNERINALEERVLALEVRQPPSVPPSRS
jgi:hypothetical protein